MKGFKEILGVSTKMIPSSVSWYLLALISTQTKTNHNTFFKHTTVVLLYGMQNRQATEMTFWNYSEYKAAGYS
jgi:hypothetical protein